VTDGIELRGLRLLARHGVLPEERARPQPFELDLDVDLDLDVAARTDELADTADYAALLEAAVTAFTASSHRLLESAAAEVADALLAQPRVEAVEVRVRKLRPPVAHDLASAGVRLSRRRSPGEGPPHP
jgi:dihydroneopterin aldolase